MTIWNTNCEDYPDFVGSACAEEVTLTPIAGCTDCCAYSSGGKIRKLITEVTGLWHLEGQEVGVVTDGGEHPAQTVSQGKISLQYGATIVHVGFLYTGLFKTMNLEGGGIQGPAQSKPKNINRLGIRFLNTLGARVGTDLYNMQEIYFRDVNDNTDRPPPLFTGDKRVVIEDDTSLEKHIYVQQTHPLPCNVLLLSPYVETDNE